MGVKIPYKGLCDLCVIEAEQRGDIAIEKWIVNKRPPLCSFHKAKSKSKSSAPKKQIKPIKRKSRKDDFHLKESEVFEMIWDEEKRVSFVTNKPLPDINSARSWYFSHVLAKGKAKYPMFKYYKKNIVFKTFKEHELWENHKYKIRDLEMWKHVFELEEELKQEYKQHEIDYQNGKAEYYKF